MALPIFMFPLLLLPIVSLWPCACSTLLRGFFHTVTPDQQKLIDAAEEKSRCGHGAVVLVNKENGVVKIVPCLCHSWRCSRCGPYLAEIWKRKIIGSKPERFITLTWSPKSDHTVDEAIDIMKKALPRAVDILRSEGFQFEYCAVMEFTKHGWPHIHLAQKGDYIPQKRLSEIWSRLGSGPIVDVRKVRSPQSLAYELTKYLLKSTRETYFLIGGRRIIQCSRRFLTTPPSEDAPADEPQYESVYTGEAIFVIADYLEREMFYELIAGDDSGTLYFLPTEPLTPPAGPPQAFEDLFHVLSRHNPYLSHAPPLSDSSEGQTERPTFNPQLVMNF